jgi:glycosyltransferase involved in cell wall biosynthesis
MHNNQMLELPFPQTHLGYFPEDKQLALAYQSADIFVCPSVEDAGPMMINESVMCGTPVVSFDMGVALDLVHTGETGYRAKLQDSSDLAQGMYDLLTLDKIEYERISKNCRNLGLLRCHPTAQIKDFEKLIDSLINNRRGDVATS